MKRGTSHCVSLYWTYINVYLLFINNLNFYLFKQSHKSLYASCIAESLCPTSFQCTYSGWAVCLWPVTLRSVRTKFATQVSGAYIYWRVVKKQYIWTFALILTNSQDRQFVMPFRLKGNTKRAIRVLELRLLSSIK